MRRWACFIFAVWFVFGAFPPWCAASDDHTSRTWRFGGSVGYMLFLSADRGVPLYSMHVQRTLMPSWTLDSRIGFTQTDLGLGSGVILRNFFIVGRPHNEHSRIIPANVGITRHLQPPGGIRVRGYVSTGISLVTVYTTDVLYATDIYAYPQWENRLGWLLGPSGALGLEIPIGRMSVDLTFLEFSYYRAVNAFLQSLNGPVFRAGVGIRL